MAFWNRKAAPAERTDADMPVPVQVMYLDSRVGVALVKWNDAIAAAEALRHPIVYRALNKIAQAVQQVNWKAEEDPDARPEDLRNVATSVAKVQEVLSSPNNEYSPAMMRYWMALNYAVYGRLGLRIPVSSLNMMIPTGFYPLESKVLHPKFNKRGVLESFDYGDGQSKVRYPSRLIHYRSPTSKGFADIIWKPGLGTTVAKDYNTPLQSIGLPAKVITALLQRAISTAEGHPNVRYLVTASRTLTEKQKQALRHHLNEEHNTDGVESGKIPIVTNAGDIKIHKLDNDLSDIHSKMPADDMMRLIFGAFDIPVAMSGIGGADGAKYANNYEGSRLSFWEDTIIPGYVSPIFQGLSRVLCPPGVRIAADYTAIPALFSGRISSMNQASDIEFLTQNEKRALFGFAESAQGSSDE